MNPTDISPLQHCIDYLEKFESSYNGLWEPLLNSDTSFCLTSFGQFQKDNNEQSYIKGATDIAETCKKLRQQDKKEYKKYKQSKEYVEYKRLRKIYDEFLGKISKAVEDQKRGVTSEAPASARPPISSGEKEAHPATAALFATTALSASKDQLFVPTEDLLGLDQCRGQAAAQSTQSYSTHNPSVHPAAAAPAAPSTQSYSTHTPGLHPAAEATSFTHASSSSTTPFHVHPAEDEMKSGTPTEEEIIKEAERFMKGHEITMEHLSPEGEQRKRSSFISFLGRDFNMSLDDYLLILATQESLKEETYENPDEQLKPNLTTHGNSIFKTSAKDYQCGYHMLAIGIMQLHFINPPLYEKTIGTIKTSTELIDKIDRALHPEDESKPNFTLHQEELGQCLKKYFTENGDHLTIINEYFSGFDPELEEAQRADEDFGKVYQVDNNLDHRTLSALASHLGIQLKFNVRPNDFGDISSFIFAHNPNGEHYDCVVHPSIADLL